MSEKTGQPMFIDSINERHPERVLKSIRVDYAGFHVVFDLHIEKHEHPKRNLTITINAFIKDDGTIEVYEHLKGAESYGRYWLIDSGHYIVNRTDPLTLLTSYLSTALGGIENSYAGSFAEVLLAPWRGESK